MRVLNNRNGFLAQKVRTIVYCLKERQQSFQRVTQVIWPQIIFNKKIVGKQIQIVRLGPRRRGVLKV